MKYFKEEQTTTSQWYKTTCDKCGCEVSNGTFRVNEIELSYLIGDSYPEGMFADSYKIDLCEPCGKQMIELLKDNGYKIQHRNSCD